MSCVHECKTSVRSVLPGHETTDERTVVESLESTRKAKFSYASIEMPTPSLTVLAFHLFVEGWENFVIQQNLVESLILFRPATDILSLGKRFASFPPIPVQKPLKSVPLL